MILKLLLVGMLSVLIGLTIAVAADNYVTASYEAKQ